MPTEKYSVDKMQSQNAIGALDAESASTLIAAASDVALVLDEDGIIRDVTVGSDEMAQEGCRNWIGLPWVDTVATDSRPKVETLLREAQGKLVRKWRHINHTSLLGADVPVLYSAVKVGPSGRVVAFGRDLRASAALQQKLVDAQQSMERHYWRLRHAETRYRLLFQMSAEAVLIIDALSRKILEANTAAGNLFGDAAKLIGRTFPEGFDAESLHAIETLLASVSAVGRADELRVRLSSNHREFLVSASLFRQDNASFFLIRLASVRGETAESPLSRSILKVMEGAPDAFVVADVEGRILTANRAFIDLAQMTAEGQVRGELLDRWLGRSGVDFNVLMSSLRQHGTIRLFASVMRGEYGAIADVEISAVSVPQGSQPCFGFSIRNVAPRLNVQANVERDQPRSTNQLTELVGRVSLKELVRESVDLVERRCIEAALELSGDNRASAAEMLGLSRQSLYNKLRRYGLGDLELEPAE